jgi:hypothetical protein
VLGQFYAVVLRVCAKFCVNRPPTNRFYKPILLLENEATPEFCTAVSWNFWHNFRVLDRRLCDEAIEIYGRADIPALLRQLTDLPSSETDNEPWFSIWSALVHQGDVYSASFAAVPHIIEALASAPLKTEFSYFQSPAWVEVCRTKKGVSVPEDIAPAYFESLSRLPSLVGVAAARPWDEGFYVALFRRLLRRKGSTQLPKLCWSFRLRWPASSWSGSMNAETATRAVEWIYTKCRAVCSLLRSNVCFPNAGRSALGQFETIKQTNSLPVSCLEASSLPSKARRSRLVFVWHPQPIPQPGCFKRSCRGRASRAGVRKYPTTP